MGIFPMAPPPTSDLSGALVNSLLVDRCNHKFNAKGDEIIDVFLDVTQQAEAADPR